MKIKNKLLDLTSPRLMGILNVTPDSFSDGGAYDTLDSALGRIGDMISQGASIIDVGGESTRPGSDPVSEQQELDRVLPILEKAIPQFTDTFFSIDTTKYQVAKQALKLGAHFINDISGMQKQPRFVDLCIKHQAGYIMMHSQGNPKTMQKDPHYDDVVNDIYAYFDEKLAQINQRGLRRVIIDPGIGFGKNIEHNLTLLANLRAFKKLGYPILIGVSRKSMIGYILGERTVDERLIGSVAAQYHALLEGANIIRVHDVKEAHDSLLIYKAIAKLYETSEVS